MNLHESLYLGEYYRAGRDGGENFVLRSNFVEVEEEWTEPSCKEHGLLLYANETDRAEFICTALAEYAELVRRRDL